MFSTRHTIITTYWRVNLTHFRVRWVLSPRVITAINENAAVQIQNSNGAHSGIDVLAARAEA